MIRFLNGPGAVSGIACTGLAVSAIRLIRRLSKRRTKLPVTLGWISELSTERYRPMLRLLDGKDLDFLRAQPGVTPERIARLRFERTKMFRAYLRCLETDFGCVSMAIRVLMAQSHDDRPDLAEILIRRRLAFVAAVALIHVRLFLYQRGFCRVDGRPLLRTFDGLRLVLRELLPGAKAVEA